MKKNIKKDCTLKLLLSILLTVCFVAGIPLIISGAKSSTILLVLGIVMTVLGFYGSPMAWINYGKICSEKSIYFAITEDNLLSAKEIASNLGRQEKEIIELINHLISSRFLTGYKLDENGKLTKLAKQKEEQESHQKELKSRKCPNCGATLTKTKDNKYICKYCGVEFDK